MSKTKAAMRMLNYSRALIEYFIYTLHPSQIGPEKPSVPLVPGGGNVSLSSDLRHVADGEPDGAVQD